MVVVMDMMEMVTTMMMMTYDDDEVDDESGVDVDDRDVTIHVLQSLQQTLTLVFLDVTNDFNCLIKGISHFKAPEHKHNQ